MWHLMLTVIPLGLAAAFTPMLLAIQIMVVSQPPWGRRALAFGLGGFSAFALVSLLFLSGFAGLRPVLALWTEAEQWIGPGLRILLGILLLIGGILLMRTGPRDQRAATGEMRRHLLGGNVHTLFLLAFALSLKDVSSFAVLLPALHDIVYSDLGLLRQAAALGVLWSLALLPLWMPPALARFAGPRGGVFLRHLYDFSMRHELALIGGMLIVVALFLLATGVGLAPW